jgi:hypothetical protein
MTHRFYRMDDFPVVKETPYPASLPDPVFVLDGAKVIPDGQMT